MERLLRQMSRLRTGSVLLLAAVMIGLVTPPPAADPLGSPPAPGTHRADGVAPNVLLVTLDDATEKMLDWRRPDGSSLMPAVQSLKNRATVFSNAFVDIPSCCPSRFSTFTGRYPHNTGGKLQSDAPELPEKQTFAHRLRNAGYSTAMAGKFLVSWTLSTPPPGYDRYTTIKSGYYDPLANRNGHIATVPGYSTSILETDLETYLAEFEAADDARPWFAYWAPQTPHTSGGFKSLAEPQHRFADDDMGTCAQPVEADRTDKPPYVSFVAPDPAYTQQLCTSQLQALRTVDARLRALTDYLKAAGEYQSTLLILTSDNGFHWGEQGWFSKFYPYEPSIGIPLYVKWPHGIGPAAGVDGRLVSSLDVTPTIYEVTGVQRPTALDGRSLLGAEVRSEVFLEYFQDPDNGDMGTWAALRGPDWKYVESQQVSNSGSVTQFTEYYNLTGDPDESDNVLADGVTGNEPSAAVLAGLHSRLDAARTCAAGTCP